MDQKHAVTLHENDALRAAFEVARVVSGCPQRFSVAPRAYFVGGCVRDALLRRATNDIDVEVYGVAGEVLEDALHELFPGRVHAVGKSFGILHVPFDDGSTLDVALPRTESKTGHGHRDFFVQCDPELSIEQAARRRDFTCNALLFDPLTDEMLDPYGGERDIQRGILRVVDAATFVEDSLRVYRALQFVGRFGFEVDPKTQVLLAEMVRAGELDTLSVDRVREEVLKLLLLAPRPSLGFALGERVGVWRRHAPELQAMVGVEQEPAWHPEGDVWTHTLMALDVAAELRDAQAWTHDEACVLMLGALCHDLGKPLTTRFEDGRIRSRDHEDAGVAPTYTLCERWGIAHDQTEMVVNIVRDHLKPAMLYNEYAKGVLDDERYARAVRRLLKRLLPAPWRVYEAVTRADFFGRTTDEALRREYVAGDMLRETIEREALDVQAVTPLVQGRDLLELGIEPGKVMGDWLRAVENARDEGVISTREEAIEFLRMKLGN